MKLISDSGDLSPLSSFSSIILNAVSFIARFALKILWKVMTYANIVFWGFFSKVKGKNLTKNMFIFRNEPKKKNIWRKYEFAKISRHQRINWREFSFHEDNLKDPTIAAPKLKIVLELNDKTFWLNSNNCDSFFCLVVASFDKIEIEIEKSKIMKTKLFPNCLRPNLMWVYSNSTYTPEVECNATRLRITLAGCFRGCIENWDVMEIDFKNTEKRANGISVHHLKIP